MLFPTVHRKTNFLENLYQDNKYSDSESPVESLRLILFFRRSLSLLVFERVAVCLWCWWGGGGGGVPKLGSAQKVCNRI